MKYKPVKFAILSPSRWGRTLLESVRQSSKFTLAGVQSRNAANAEEIAANFGGRVYPSYEEILADKEIEAVVLPTPNFLHYSQTMSAFAAGKHVFVEKPIANSLAEAREMQRMSVATGLILAVGMQGRRTGAALKTKKMLDGGELGRVALAVAIHGAPLLASRQDGNWYTSAEKSPGGPLDQLGVHYADLMQFWFGPVKRVTAFYTTSITPYSVPDAATVSFEFENGLLGSYSTQQVSAYVSRLGIYGTLGAVHFNRFGQELLWEDVIPPQTAKKEGPQVRTIDFEGPHPFTTALTQELEEFADCIRLGGKPLVGAAEGIAALRLVRAAMKSQETGRAIILDEFEN